MYPNLETERLILKPLNENDFESMYRLESDPSVISSMEGELYNDPEVYKKDFAETVKGGECFSIRIKETGLFVGFIMIHQYIKQGRISYSQMVTAILPEYWNLGYCTEATKKLLHFAFLGIKTPWLCANQFQDNPAAGNVLRKCGLRFHKTWKMQNRPYDQYRYKIDEYLKDNNISAESDGIYNFSLDLKTSPYSFENPVRKIDGIEYVREPTGYLCGQSVIAMLAAVPVDEAIKVMGTDKGTSTAAVGDALDYYGFKHAKTRKKYTPDTVLPDICILGLQLPGYGHWSLYYKGTYFDPEFGVSDRLPEKAKLVYYWEIKN